MHRFPNGISDETFNRGPMTFFKVKLMKRTFIDETGNYAMPNRSKGPSLQTDHSNTPGSTDTEYGSRLQIPEGLYFISCENQGADQLRGDLRLCFCKCGKQAFS